MRGHEVHETGGLQQPRLPMEGERRETVRQTDRQRQTQTENIRKKVMKYTRQEACKNHGYLWKVRRREERQSDRQRKIKRDDERHRISSNTYRFDFYLSHAQLLN